MTIDAGTASVIVAAIAALSALANTRMTMKQSRKVDETHKQVTVNHHSSEFPTVLDRIDDVRGLAQQAVTDVGSLRSEVNHLHTEFNSHVAHSNEMDARLLTVESEVHRPR